MLITLLFALWVLASSWADERAAASWYTHTLPHTPTLSHSSRTLSQGTFTSTNRITHFSRMRDNSYLLSTRTRCMRMYDLQVPALMDELLQRTRTQSRTIDSLIFHSPHSQRVSFFSHTFAVQELDAHVWLASARVDGRAAAARYRAVRRDIAWSSSAALLSQQTLWMLKKAAHFSFVLYEWMIENIYLLSSCVLLITSDRLCPFGCINKILHDYTISHHIGLPHEGMI